MAHADPVADLITRIRNGKEAKHRYVEASFSRMKKDILEVLKKTGFIENYITNDSKKRIRVFLKFTKDRGSVIQDLKRESKPSCRKYLSYKDIPIVLGGLGIAIISTPLGVMDGNSARKNKVGGEYLCSVW